jgi:hypothetical protein
VPNPLKEKSAPSESAASATAANDNAASDSQMHELMRGDFKRFLVSGGLGIRQRPFCA